METSPRNMSLTSTVKADFKYISMGNIRHDFIETPPLRYFCFYRRFVPSFRHPDIHKQYKGIVYLLYPVKTYHNSVAMGF